MAAKSTPAKIMGTIGAMQTLVENFPMSILDISNGPTYTSSFMFMADVLKACGIGVDRILEYLIEKIFGYNVDFDADPESIYTAIDSLPIDEQSDFINALETSVKGIIWTVLMGLFSCSAVPILPNTYFDKGKEAQWFTEYGYDEVVAKAGGGKGMYISPQMLDYFGYFDVSPFSKQGKIFYNVEGRDIYYVKRRKDPTSTEQPPKKIYRVGIQFAPGQRNKLVKTAYQFVLDAPIDKTIDFTIGMTPKLYSHIRPGETTSLTVDFNPTERKVESIGLAIDSVEPSTETEISLGGDKKLILDKDLSKDVIKYWKTIKNDGYELVDWRTVSEPVAGDDDDDDAFVYERYDGFIPNAVRVYNMIKATKDSADSIVCYQGQDPNTLYKTQDFNAFIWYVLNRSANIPQVELNKNMWDNRVYANQYGPDAQRLTPVEWNEWYNSKSDETKEFKLEKDKAKILKPILQLRNEGGNLYAQFPSQTYFKPKVADSEVHQKTIFDMRLNSSIYRFNWDYLQSIRIFNPKSLLFGFADGMLGGMLTMMAGVNISLTMQETSARLSNAIKKYIEMEDTEISDCYTSFSNEEFDNLLEDMILSRYGATRYGGEVNRAQVHDVNDLISQLDAINLSSSPEGATTQIMRTINQVTVTEKPEGGIKYGVDVRAEGGIFQKILWAIAMPIVKSIFTPQLILLFLINFNIMGITSLNDTLGTNQGAIVKLIFNKIFTMVRQIIIFIADSLIQLLFMLFVKVITPLLLEWGWLEALEQIDDWLQLLVAVAMCLPRINLRSSKPKGTIDEVDYADITDEQTAPENVTNC